MNDIISLYSPAQNFTEGFPIGNGRIAAMSLGSKEKLSLILNHEWLWDNRGKARVAQNASHHLDEVRELLLSGEYKKGTKLANDYFSIQPGAIKRGSYLTAGIIDISADYGEISDYNRKLYLKEGYCEITFISSNLGFVSQKIFVSITDDIGAVLIKTERTGEIKISLSPAEGAKAKISADSEDNSICLSGNFPVDMEYAVKLKITAKSKAIACENALKICDDELFLQFNIGTNAKGNKPQNELIFSPEALEVLLDRHSQKFRKSMGNTELNLGEEPDTDDTALRCEFFRLGKDNTLPVLFFNLGKYFYACEALGELPLNLQGKWNDEIEPPWQCGYHFDINLQMNYWAAPILGMDEQTLPLFNYLEACVQSGKVMAKNIYGCEGICYSLCGDAFGKIAPQAFGWDVWIGAAPWLAAHFMSYYEYTLDEKFLRERAYPFIKEAAKFAESYAYRHNGETVIVPSCSPENRFIGAGDLPISMCKNSAMDIQLFNEVLHSTIRCAEILGVDAEQAQKWQELRDSLPPLKIADDGRIVEWDYDHEEWEPEHRHLSHLYGMYPGDRKACRGADIDNYYKSLKARISSGGGQTGWSRGWICCLMAKMQKGAEAYDNLKKLIAEQCSVSMLDLHPPFAGRKKPIFQIDGNLGGTAAICEMLISSDMGEIRLLPALPAEWSRGSFKGLKAKGNITVNAVWENGKLLRAEFSSHIPQKFKVILPDNSVSEITLNGFDSIQIDTMDTV